MIYLAIWLAAFGGALVGFICGERFGYERGVRVCRNGEWN